MQADGNSRKGAVTAEKPWAGEKSCGNTVRTGINLAVTQWGWRQ